MNWPTNRRYRYPNAGAVIVTVTRRLFGGKLAPDQTGPPMPTHFTSPLPWTFDSEAEARAFVARLPSGVEYAVERVEQTSPARQASRSKAVGGYQPDWCPQNPAKPPRRM